MSTTLVVMGVSGSGKTTVAQGVAQELGWDLLEGDDLHPPGNRAKLAAGEPLTDADREPWLADLATWIGVHERDGADAVLTCSALRRRYRDVLRDGHPSVCFVHVSVDAVLLAERLAHRTGHFLDPSLLGSQLATLEPLELGERGVVVPGDGPVTDVVAAVVAAMRALVAGP